MYGRNKTQIFKFCGKVTVGSKDPLQEFLKGHIVQEGSIGTHFNQGLFGIKPFPIYAPPTHTHDAQTLN